MPRGFFSLQTIQKAPAALIPKCGSCGLYKRCKSPKMPYSGKGKMGVLIVAEAPGRAEDEEGIQLCGKLGRLLERMLRDIDVDMRTDCWLTNALICRPPDNKIQDDRMIDWCRPNLTNTIRELNPRIIIPLGGTAIRSLIGPLWKEDVGPVERWLGWRIPNQNPNTWICPSSIEPGDWNSVYKYKKPNSETLDFIHRCIKQNLIEAFALKKRPWKKPPNFEERVIVELDPKKAAEHIMLFTECSRGPLAFDYENNCLRPYIDQAQIVCCSISDGHKSVAFPGMGPAVRAMQSFLKSPVRKSGWNIKHEESWTRREFGHGVRGWDADGMLKTHWMDNRAGITSLKFQAYVKLGVGDYDSHIKPFLKAAGANQLNRIKEIPIKDLCRYCGYDSLYEAILTRIHKKEESYASA